MTCSGTNAFHVDALNYGGVLSGCYADSGQLATPSDLPIFSKGGVKKNGQPVIYAYDSSSVGHHVWTFGIRTDSESLIVWYCTDASSEDAHVLGHPTNVRQWDCWDEDDQTHANEYSVTTTCGCEGAPSLASPLKPAPEAPGSASSFVYTDEGAAGCLGVDSFRVTSKSDSDEDNIHGCYQDSGQMVASNLLPIFTVGGVDEREQPAVFAYKPTLSNHDVWTIGLWDSSGLLIGGYCMDARSEDAHALGHPTNVLLWNCWDEDDQAHTNVGYVTATCGCEGNHFPMPPLSPAPVATAKVRVLATTPSPVAPTIAPTTPAPAPETRPTPSPATPGTITVVPIASAVISAYEGPDLNTTTRIAPMGVIVSALAMGLFVTGAVVTAFMSKTRRRMSTPCIQPRGPEKSL